MSKEEAEQEVKVLSFGVCIICLLLLTVLLFTLVKVTKNVVSNSSFESLNKSVYMV